MTIEQQIQELRAEFRNAADATEHRAIAMELECAQAEPAVTMVEMDVAIDAQPPF